MMLLHTHKHIHFYRTIVVDLKRERERKKRLMLANLQEMPAQNVFIVWCKSAKQTNKQTKEQCMKQQKIHEIPLAI